MGVDLDGRGGVEEMGRVEGDETIIRIWYVREKNLFSIEKNDIFFLKMKCCCVKII